MSSIQAITLEADDPQAAADSPTSGFRAFTLSLLVAQPADADLLLTAALDAGATTLKPALGPRHRGEQAVLRRPRLHGRQEHPAHVRRVRGGRRPVKLGLYKRRALAKDAGVAPEGTGSHRLAIATDAGAFTDPDGFAWEPAAAPALASA